MNAFNAAKKIEQQSLGPVAAWLENGPCHSPVTIPEWGEDKGRHVERGAFGDILARFKKTGIHEWVEVKAEQHYTGNLYIEIWSDLYNRPGWLFTSRADWMAYVFLEERVHGVFFHMPTFREWWKTIAKGSLQVRTQEKYQQLNNSSGLLLPIKDYGFQTVVKPIEIEWPRPVTTKPGLNHVAHAQVSA